VSNKANLPCRHTHGEEELVGQAPPYMKNIGLPTPKLRRDDYAKQSQSPAGGIPRYCSMLSFRHSCPPTPGEGRGFPSGDGGLTGSGGGYRLSAQPVGSAMGDTGNRNRKGKSWIKGFCCGRFFL
jgi:hypothetical protein